MFGQTPRKIVLYYIYNMLHRSIFSYISNGPDLDGATPTIKAVTELGRSVDINTTSYAGRMSHKGMQNYLLIMEVEMCMYGGH